MFVLIDVGGSKTRVAVTLDLYTIENYEIFPTLIYPEQNFFKIGKFVKENIKKYKKEVIAVCLGLPGVIENSILKKAPNLTNWERVNFKLLLKKHFKFNYIYILNDASLCGLGEAIRGAGKKFDIVSYITISTGVGGVKIINGEIEKSAFGFEPGHQIIGFDENLEPSYFEDYVSGGGIERNFKRDVLKIKEKEFWSNVTKILSFGINNIVVMMSPEAIILGGGMILHNLIKISEIESNLKNCLRIFSKSPVILKSELGDLGGIYGGMQYLKKQLLKYYY